MTYHENLGQLHDLRKRREIIETQIRSHRESMRNALPLVGEVADIQGEYIMQLAISLNEKCHELQGYDKKIAVLSRETGQ